MATNKVAYWTDIADYDLKTAEAMYQTGRWLYVAFMCHQVIEKTIKAYNIEARYPEDKAELARALSPKVCRDLIDNTKQLQQWIKEKL